MTRHFWRLFSKLSSDTQQDAKRAYRSRISRTGCHEERSTRV